MILGADVCGKFVQAICPGEEVAESEDVITIPILRNGHQAKQRSQRKNIGPSQSHDMDNKTPSPLIWALEPIDVSKQSKVWFLVHAKAHGLVVIQPEAKFFNKLELICTSGVAQKEPDKVLQLRIANFANITRQIVNCQLSAQISRTCLVRSPLSLQKDFCIEYERPTVGE